jgi:hypothetical protein
MQQILHCVSVFLIGVSDEVSGKVMKTNKKIQVESVFTVKRIHHAKTKQKERT